MTQPQKIFFVRADDENGENQDLLVVATDKAQVVGYWREYYDLDDSHSPDWVGALPNASSTDTPGPIPWAVINPK